MSRVRILDFLNSVWWKLIYIFQYSTVAINWDEMIYLLCIDWDKIVSVQFLNEE